MHTSASYHHPIPQAQPGRHREMIDLSQFINVIPTLYKDISFNNLWVYYINC